MKKLTPLQQVYEAFNTENTLVNFGHWLHNNKSHLLKEEEDNIVRTYDENYAEHGKQYFNDNFKTNN